MCDGSILKALKMLGRSDEFDNGPGDQNSTTMTGKLEGDKEDELRCTRSIRPQQTLIQTSGRSFSSSYPSAAQRPLSSHRNRTIRSKESSRASSNFPLELQCREQEIRKIQEGLPQLKTRSEATPVVSSPTTSIHSVAFPKSLEERLSTNRQASLSKFCSMAFLHKSVLCCM